jgi:hypothetical protein
MKKLLILFLLMPLLGNATKKISILFDPATNPIIKGSGKTFAIRLDEAPSASVTVSFSSQNSYVTFSSALTFTTGNWATPQSFTITGATNGIVEGNKTERITLTPSGGGYSTLKTFSIEVTDTGLDAQFISGYNWLNPEFNGINIDVVGDIATKRTAAISYLFNGAGLPTDDTPDTDVAHTSGSIFNDAFGGFTGYNSIRKLTWVVNDVDGYAWTQTNYHFIKTGATKCVFVHRGHGSEAYGTEIINQLLAAGYSVLYCGMPVTLTDNIEANPTVTSTGTNAHNSMSTGGLDRVGYSPMSLFLYDKICALNYLDANYSYTEYDITGCSGGGWSVVMLMAIDTRFQKGVSVRGSKPAQFRNFTDEGTILGWDYEQGSIASANGIAGAVGASGARVRDFYLDVTFFDLYLMACSGGRSLHLSNHAADGCCNNKFTYNLWKDYIKSKASQLGGTFNVTLNTDASYTTHGWNVNDRAIIASEF